MQLSKQELESQSLTPETLREAVDQIQVNGYVVFEGALPKNLISELQTTFFSILESNLNRLKTEARPVNEETPRGKNRYMMHLPFIKPFIDPQIITSPFVLPIMDQLLGKEYTIRYFASDTPLPGSDYQNVHSDDQPLFPESDLTLPPAALVLNIPLVDVTEENGPMEIWPGGSHRIPEKLNHPKRIQELSDYLPSNRVLIPAGSLLIRDLRMWHRGTPNNADTPRPNIALIYNRPWYVRDHQSPLINVPKDTYEQLSSKAKELFRLENIQ